MRISIAARYRPFSHVPGAACLLPKSSWKIQAFPTLLQFYSISGEKEEVPLPFSGPVKEFTLQQDLEKGCVWVWGVAKEGRFRLRIEADQGLLRIDGEPQFSLSGPVKEAPLQLERISFGSHQAQNWDKARQRADLFETLPVLFALSQWIPIVESPRTAMFDLLDRMDENFLRAAFSGILCPRLIDEEHLGLLPKEIIPKDAYAIALIAKAGAKIRSHLIAQQGNCISFPILKNLSGRMVNAQLQGIGSLDFEWRKGEIRRAVLHAKEDALLSFDLPKTIRSFRLRIAQHERGTRMDASKEWSVEKDGVYLLDRFEK